MPTPTETWRRPMVAMHDEGPPRDAAPTQTNEPRSDVRPSPLPAPSVPPPASLGPLSKHKRRRDDRERLDALEADVAGLKGEMSGVKHGLVEVRGEVKRARDSAVDLRAELMNELGNVRASNDGVKSTLDVAVLGISNLSAEVSRQRTVNEKGATASLAVQSAAVVATGKAYKVVALILAAILIQIAVSWLKR